MSTIVVEYQRYQKSNVMQKLAAFAHEVHYEGQTSSATFQEISCLLRELDLRKNASFLDLGCGNGSFARKIVKEFDYKVTGVDLSQDLIDQANQCAIFEKISDCCKFQKDDFVLLNTLTNHERFDGLISVGSLYWNQPLNQTISTWNKHLVKNGYLIIFSNLMVKELTDNEQKSIGETKFINKAKLQEILINGFEVCKWENRTSSYITWLKKWCEGMELFQQELYQEMGAESASLLILRFRTYLKLALQEKVLREIIVVKKRDLF